MRFAVGRLVILFVLLVSADCSARRGQNARVDRNLITHEQITTNRFTTAFDAVEALRSNWLHTKGTDSFGTPGQVRVYLDDTRLGGVETLREIAANTVVYIRYFDGVTATQRWGLDHGQGVIFVSTHP